MKINDITTLYISSILQESILIEDKVSDLTARYSGKLSKFGDPAELVNQMAAIDPSANTKKYSYLEWMIRGVVLGRFSVPRDSSDIKELLFQFDKKKQNLSVKDIFQIGSLDQLRDVIQASVTKQTNKKTNNKYEKDIIYKGPYGIVVNPKSKKSSIYWGNNTSWCTARDDEKNMYDYYCRRTPDLYYLIKGPNEKYSFAFSGVDIKQTWVDKDNKFLGKMAYELIENIPILIDKFHKLDDDDKSELGCSFDKLLPNEQREILRDAETAYEHARYIIQCRFPEGEPIIATEPKYSYEYAKYVIQGRFPEGEPIIATDPESAYAYAKYVIQGRFPEGEPIIATNLDFAFDYAHDVIKSRFPEGEPIIATDPESAYAYAKYVIQGRFPAGETAIATDANFSYEYAYGVINDEFPEGERIIMSEPYYLDRYREFVKKCRARKNK